MNIVKSVAKEFETQPISTIAGAASLVAIPVTLFGSLAIQQPQATHTNMSAPIGLLMTGAFAIFASFAASHLSNRFSVLSGYFVSLLLAVFSQALVGVAARSFLPGQIKTVDRVVPVQTYGGENQKEQVFRELVVAGLYVDSVCFALSLIVLIVFVAGFIAQLEKENLESGADFMPTMLSVGIFWIAIVLIGGGAVMESVLRAGL